MSETIETPANLSFFTRVAMHAAAKVEAAKNGETEETNNETTAKKRKIVKVALGVTALAAAALVAYKLTTTDEDGESTLEIEPSEIDFSLPE